MTYPLIQYKGHPTVIGMPTRRILEVTRKGKIKYVRFIDNEGWKMWAPIDVSLGNNSPFTKGQEITYDCEECEGTGRVAGFYSKFDDCPECKKGKITYICTGEQELIRVSDAMLLFLEQEHEPWYEKYIEEPNLADYIILAQVQERKT